MGVTRRGNLNGVIPWLGLRAALRNVILRADRPKLRRERGRERDERTERRAWKMDGRQAGGRQADGRSPTSAPP